MADTDITFTRAEADKIIAAVHEAYGARGSTLAISTHDRAIALIEAHVVPEPRDWTCTCGEVLIRGRVDCPVSTAWFDPADPADPTAIHYFSGDPCEVCDDRCKHN